MPKGDPAGYLPNVVKSRVAHGQPAYQPRGKTGVSASQRRQTEEALEREAMSGARKSNPLGNCGYKPRRKRGLA